MAVDMAVRLVVQNTLLEERLVGLSSRGTAKIGEFPAQWRFQPRDSVRNLLDLMAEGKGLDTPGLDNVVASGSVHFPDLADGDDPVQGADRYPDIHLTYYGNIQSIAYKSLGLSVLLLSGYPGNAGIHSLFSPWLRQRFFAVLESMGTVYGEEYSHDAVGEDDDELAEVGEVYVSGQNLLIIGSHLVKMFAPGALETTLTFAKWVLDGPMFVFASPTYFFKMMAEDTLQARGLEIRELSDWPMVQRYVLGDDELSSAFTPVKTYGEYTYSVQRSWEALSAGLSLPRTINLREHNP